MNSLFSKRTGKLIIISGIDGSGKTTQIKQLCAHMECSGSTVTDMFIRGGFTPFYKKVRSLVKLLYRKPQTGSSGPSGTKKFSVPSRFQGVYVFTSLLELLWLETVVVRWHLLMGKTLVCDRYHWDTLVIFQQQFPHLHVEQSWLWRLLTRVAARPSLCLFFNLPPEVARERIVARGVDGHETIAELDTRARAYARVDQSDWVLLDATQEPQVLAEHIWKKVGEALFSPEGLAVAL